MTKTECLARAADYNAQADREIDMLARMTVIFGGSSPEAKGSESMVQRFRAAAIEYHALAQMHPKTREKTIREWVA